jgi:hypothetical protein
LSSAINTGNTRGRCRCSSRSSGEIESSSFVSGATRRDSQKQLSLIQTGS